MLSLLCLCQQCSSPSYNFFCHSLLRSLFPVIMNYSSLFALSLHRSLSLCLPRNVLAFGQGSAAAAAASASKTIFLIISKLIKTALQLALIATYMLHFFTHSKNLDMYILLLILSIAFALLSSEFIFLTVLTVAPMISCSKLSQSF